MDFAAYNSHESIDAPPAKKRRRGRPKKVSPSSEIDDKEEQLASTSALTGIERGEGKRTSAAPLRYHEVMNQSQPRLHPRQPAKPPKQAGAAKKRRGRRKNRDVISDVLSNVISQIEEAAGEASNPSPSAYTLISPGDPGRSPKTSPSAGNRPPKKSGRRKGHRTGYNIYFKSYVDRMRQSGEPVPRPSTSGGAARVVGAAWQKLSPDEKKFYEAEAQKFNSKITGTSNNISAVSEPTAGRNAGAAPPSGGVAHLVAAKNGGMTPVYGDAGKTAALKSPPSSGASVQQSAGEMISVVEGTSAANDANGPSAPTQQMSAQPPMSAMHQLQCNYHLIPGVGGPWPPMAHGGLAWPGVWSSDAAPAPQDAPLGAQFQRMA